MRGRAAFAGYRFAALSTLLKTPLPGRRTRAGHALKLKYNMLYNSSIRAGNPFSRKGISVKGGTECRLLLVVGVELLGLFGLLSLVVLLMLFMLLHECPAVSCFMPIV